MTRQEFEGIVQEALESMPEEIARYLEEVVVVVEERATPGQMEGLDGDDPMDLYGLYEGVPLTERSLFESGIVPDRVTIFQAPLERDFRARTRLRREIQKTVAHEVAHHFGIDEDRLDELGLA